MTARSRSGHTRAVSTPARTRPELTPATLATVAQAAGVSVPTVSRVLNGKGQVAPATRARVEEALRRHGYQRRARSSADSRELDL